MADELEETPRAAAAFALYRDMTPSSRSLTTLVEAFYDEPPAVKRSPEAHRKFAESKVRQLKKWSSAHHWQERVKVSDQERQDAHRQRLETEQEAKRHQQEAAIEEMNARHITMAVEQQEKLVANIGVLISTGNFGAIASVQALKLVTDLERLARGEATERTEQQQTGTISVTLTPATAQQIADKTPDELAEWRKRRGLPPSTEEHLG